MINKIGVENFRIFKEYTEFELKPLTILTGPNNAGKSSLTKLLLLLNNGIGKLDFKKGNHNLEDFNKILNWDKEGKELTISIELDNNLVNGLYYEFKYKNSSKLNSVSVRSDNETLLNFDYFSGKPENEYDISGPTIIYNLKFNINYIINLIYNYKIVFNPKNWGGEFIEKYNDKALEKDGLLYNISHLGIDITAKHRDRLLKIQEEVFNNIFFEYVDDFKDVFIFDRLFEHLELMNKKAKEQIKIKLEEKLKIEGIKFKNSLLGDFMFDELSFSQEIGSYQNIVEFDHRKFLECLFIKDSFNFNFQYISPNRGNQKRVLENKSESEIDEIVAEFYDTEKIRNRINNKEQYLKEILKILEIDGEIAIERYENTISVIYLVKEGKKINLADLGFGYSQLLPIILKIINCYSKKNLDSDGFYWPTIIIEEPEANLHPNLQSKLADIFAISLKFIPYVRFIVETHSEYFIRKLQYLTAKNEIELDQSIIYYFNADKYVNAQEPKVKPIEIRKDGNLSDTFGPGFYDEATMLKFDLINLNKSQFN